MGEGGEEKGGEGWERGGLGEEVRREKEVKMSREGRRS